MAIDADRGRVALTPLQVHFSPLERDYSGRELRSHFAFDEFALIGDSAVAWIGPCRVDVGELVDLVDARAGAFIASPSMAHFIVEHFGVALVEAVLRQRLLARLGADLLREGGAPAVQVRGNDLFADGRKASVSVATLSPTSALIHFAVNIRTDGTPVPTFGLSETALQPERFARELLGRYAAELADIHRAAAKVRGVR